MLERENFRADIEEKSADDGCGDPVTEKIRLVIDRYKKDFALVNKQERYKWEAIGWYQRHWNIDAVDFPQMLETAFGKAGNLLASGMYYPYKMLVGHAKADPEEVRRIFKVLHDEQLPLAERYQIFRSSSKARIDQIMKQQPERTKALQHYQDIRAIMVYLTFQYPEKYYLFKSRMFADFRERVGYTEEKPKQASSLWKVESYTRLCDMILQEVKKDPELIRLTRDRLDDSCYQDEALHLLTMDLVYYGSAYMDAGDFADSSADEILYWPSLEEYNPGISKEAWTAILKDASITTPENLDMLRKMLELGGESTCAHLAQVYGKTHGYYNKLGSSYGERIKKKYHCPDCIDREGDATERNRVYVIPFVGRYVTEDGNRRYSWKLRQELQQALIELEGQKTEEVGASMTDIGLNTILCGPPGTGKTYHTVIYAVAIIENKKLAQVEKEDYAQVLDRYNAYKAQGLIEFTTFHQSYGYEDFIEGIKPVVSSGEENSEEFGQIQYSVQAGVFKRFCEKAERPAVADRKDYGVGENPSVWKVSLYGTGDNPVRAECLKNGHIRIGWDNYGKDITDETDYDISGGKVVLNAFLNRMQIGDIVLSCYSATTIDAVGVVTGDYEWHEEYDTLKRLRKVKWLVKNIRENIMDITDGTVMMQMSVYRLNVSLANVFRIVEKYRPSSEAGDAKKSNFVFIIDEINRGNISKIFGELITLIESGKRMGQQEERMVRLPYSLKLFGVPQNVYIIGTMNTADRSIAAIDTALRRRFLFREMLPDPSVLRGVYVEDLPVAELLTRINKRITVLYDREHTIGHACFMPLKTSPTIEVLADIFSNSILPLLQEYFYEDYEKIRLVLGDNQKESQEYAFILKHANDYGDLFGSGDVDLDEGFSYEINKKAFGEIEAYRSI